MDASLGYHDDLERRGLVGNNNNGSYYNRDFYSNFYRNLSWVPKIPAVLSIFASAYILQDILKQSTKRSKMTNQIMVGLCVADIGYSLAHMVGTWAVVEGQVWGSNGTIATCEAQGFLHLSFFHIGSFYNAALALTYVLMVRFGFKDESFRKYKQHYVMLLLPPMLGIAVAVPNFSNNNFNYTGQWLCSGGPWPVGCDEEKTVPCIRGESMTDMFANTECFVMCFWLAVGCAAIILVSMLVLYCTVLVNERAMDKYQFRTEGSSTSIMSEGHQQQLRRSMIRRQSNDVAYQGIFYVWAYIINSLCFILLNVPKRWFSHEIDLAIALVSPLQGCLNVLVYLRPRYLQYRRKHPSNSCSAVLRDILRRICNLRPSATNAKKKNNDNNCDSNRELSDNQEPTDANAGEDKSDTIEMEDYADCEPSMLFLLDAPDPIGPGNNDKSDVVVDPLPVVNVDVLKEGANKDSNDVSD